MAEDCTGLYKYETCLSSNSCTMFTYVPEKYRCQLVKDIHDCDENTLVIHYMDLFGCKFNADQRLYLGIPLVILVLGVLFLILSITADMFFAPSLCAISDKTKMSENLAGVTLLAFGNASTDVITSVIEADKAGIHLVLAHQIGGGMIVLVLVAGVVILQGTFSVEPWDLFRNIIFSLVAFMTITEVCSTQRLYIIHGVVLILLYIVYVVSFAIENYLRRRKMRKSAPPRLSRMSAYARVSRYSKARRYSRVSTMSRGIRKSTLSGFTGVHEGSYTSGASVRIIKSSASNQPLDVTPRQSPRSSPHESVLHSPQESGKIQIILPEGDPSVDDITEEIEREPLLVGDQILPPPAIPRPRSVSAATYTDNVLASERLRVLADAGREEQVQEERQGMPEAIGVEIDGAVYKKPDGLCQDFINEIMPFDEEEWRVSKCFGRFMIIVRMPFVFCLKFIIPTVNHTSLKNGWCKLLNCIHCVTTPTFLYIAFGVYKLYYTKLIPVTVTIYVVSFGTACLVFVTSTVSRPPIYHLAFAVLGFVASFSVIYVVALELISVLVAVGFLLRIRLVSLGLTLLAVGNNVGDMVSDVALAREGYSQMGFAGSFGATLFAVLLGGGLSFTYLVAVHGGEYYFEFEEGVGGLLFNGYFFILAALSSYALCIPTMGYIIPRTFGIYMVVLYAMFLLFAILCEFKIIHALSNHL